MEFIRYFVFCAITLASLSTHADTPDTQFTVEPVWLAANLSNSKLLIVDVRPKNDYIQGHIESAISFDVELTFNEDMMASLSTIKKLLESRGISPETSLILYDSGNFIDASRLFWVLETIGHQKISILNMGFGNWNANNLPITLHEPTRTVSNYPPTINLNRIKTMMQIRLTIQNQKSLILDARPADEYKGFVSKTDRFGHIPTAINIPFSNNLILSGGKLKSLDDLKQLYSDLDKQKPVITYCNRGKQSALNYFILRRLGYKVSAYDGSWLEWSQTRGNPIEK